MSSEPKIYVCSAPELGLLEIVREKSKVCQKLRKGGNCVKVWENPELTLAAKVIIMGSCLLILKDELLKVNVKTTSHTQYCCS